MKPVTLLFVLFSAALWTGCASSTKKIEARKQEKFSAYSALPADKQALVDQGKIAPGMSMDAVYIAWGPPATIVSTQTAEGPLVTWVYYGNYAQPYRYWDMHPQATATGYYYSSRAVPETGFVPSKYIQSEIIFKDNVVQQYRSFDPPPEF